MTTVCGVQVRYLQEHHLPILVSPRPDEDPPPPPAAAAAAEEEEEEEEEEEDAYPIALEWGEVEPAKRVWLAHAPASGRARDSDEPDDAQWVRPSPHARPRVRSRTVPPCAQSPRQALPLLLLEIRGPLSPLTESEARPVRDTRAAARLC
jgi:hypothetical protein